MMDIETWLSQFGPPTDARNLASPDAVALVSFVQRYALEIARIVEVRASDDSDLVVLDFQTARPQASVWPIKQCERIGVRFSVHGAMPLVYMLRPDFPDTEHQQLTIEGSPRAICIDDRPWAEARLTWTPAELVQRIFSWFSRAILGQLHDARQPIDPVLAGSTLSFLISRSLLQDAWKHDLICIHNTGHRQTLRVRPIQGLKESVKDIEPVCVIAYRVAPERMTRMQFAPNNLSSLAVILQSRDVTLLEDLSQRLSDWLAQGEAAAWRLNARFVIVVEMPIVSPRGDQQDGTDLRAYVTGQSAGDMAVALGVAFRADTKDEGSGVGYVMAVVPTSPNEEAIRAISLDVAEIHYEFDRPLATRLAGLDQQDARKAVLVGAGAIGSHVADCLLREGRFSWTVIDDDYLLPHNLARHTGRSADVTQNKAEIVAGMMNSVFDIGESMPVARAIDSNVFSGGHEGSQTHSALCESDLIIDASASVLVERYLSDHESNARRTSIFFTPSGKGAVLLSEPADRLCTLRDLEAQYLGLVAEDARLGSHLQDPTQSFAYTGACRAITNMIPQSSVLTLSGLVSSGLGEAVSSPKGMIKLWSLRDNGSVDTYEFVPEPVRQASTDDWVVSISEGVVRRIMDLRRSRLPNETGGLLFGVVDIPSKRIHVVVAAPAPPDSEETSSGFVRGTQCVKEYIDRVSERTKGQVRYVGEWHSHPPRATSLPSSIDLAQIDWLATLFDMDTLPALMVIAGDRDLRIILANKQTAPVADCTNRRADSP